jgi:hypothetical protein
VLVFTAAVRQRQGSLQDRRRLEYSSRSGLHNPEYVLANPEGLTIQQNRLVVADVAANRYLRYDPFVEWAAETETIISPPAKAVLGQNDFGVNSVRPNRGQPEPNGSTVWSR